MRVAKTLSSDAYWEDPRFRRKRPEVRGSLKYRYEDDICHRDERSAWEQADSRCSLNDGAPNYAHIARDTSCNRRPRLPALQVLGRSSDGNPGAIS